MLTNVTESLNTDSTNVAAGVSQTLVVANPERSGLLVSTDGASTVFLLLGSGTASATNFTVALTTNAPMWGGKIGDSGPLWRGAVQMFGTTARVAVSEV